ncbi:MAG TPA: hypothetical protein VKE51_17190, partial [Vicinamibacterales bacterium]|nr:hypothetical protein [Vicinamibacterales bacterium]
KLEGWRMHKGVIVAAGLAAAVVAAIPAARAGASDTAAPFTVAVYGDAPYGTKPTDTAEFNATPAFIASINADPDVAEVIHVGDIHSGKQFCTEAYDRSIYQLWTAYTKPLVYTPGDNEWTDCHKSGEGGGTYNPTTGQINYVLDSSGQPVDYAGGNPLANLALVRSIFFAEPGQTLGSGTMEVTSQADVYDPHHQTDAQFVENVIWVQGGVVFVTINVPGGSNNDADPWYGTPFASAPQQQEAARRTSADLRWLRDAFDLARTMDAPGIVVVTQADMWDLDNKTPDHLTNYEPIVSVLASRTAAFGGPVLLFTGDSHVYRSDNPLVQAAPCTGDNGVCTYDAWNSHPYYDVPNFHRIVVHGSTIPLEWLKLTVDPAISVPESATAFGPFSWERMPQP